MSPLRTALALFLFVLGTSAFATTRTWVGPASGNWSNASNWSPAGVPADGDSLSFPSGTVFTVTNDVGALTLPAISGGAAGSVLDGYDLTITSSMSLTGWIVTLDVYVAGTVSLDADFRGILDSDNATINFPLISYPIKPLAYIRGPFTGSGALKGSVIIAHDSLFSGTVDSPFFGVDGASLPNLDVTNANLIGNGTLGAVDTGAFGVGIWPTSSLAGWPASSNTIAVLSMSSLTVGTRYSVDIDGGSGTADQLIVAGPVSLAGDLAISIAGPAPAIGQSFVIINHTGAGPVSGHFGVASSFLSLTEGMVFKVDNTYFRITYQGGDGNDVVLDVVAPPPPTTTTASVSPNAVLTGQNVTFTAHVAYLDGSGFPSDGTVIFEAADTHVALATAPLVSGTATATTTFYGDKVIPVIARYLGGSAGLPSQSDPVSLTVHTVPVTIEAHTSPNPSVSTDPVRLFVTLTNGDDPSAPVSGTIYVWNAYGPEGGVPIGGQVGTFNGPVEIDLHGLPLGDYVFSIQYESNLPFAGQWTTTSVHRIIPGVNPGPAPTTTTLTPSKSSMTYGETTTITATVAGPPAPTGSVTFFIDGHPLGTTALAGGTATMNSGVVAAGTHALTAAYSGDATSAASTSPGVSLTVARAHTTVLAEPLSNPVPLGAPVLLNASVSLGTTTAAIPLTGVLSVRENGVLLAQHEGVTNGTSVVIPVSGLTVGNHLLVADFTGEDVEVNSATVTEQVTQTGATPAISVADVAVAEGNGATSVAAVPVWLSGASAQSVTVVYQTEDGDAKAGTDYVPAFASLTFAPGEVAKSIPVQILGNTSSGPNRTFLIRLVSPTGATLGRATAAATIVDDDSSAHHSSFSYATAGGPALSVDVDTPPSGAGPFPVVVWIGGIGDYEPGGPSPAMHELARGYAVVTPSYRGSDAAHFPAQRDDLQAAIRWIRSNAAQLGLDPRRIAVWGAGAGAHLATLVALSDGDEASRPQAAIDWGGATDLLTLQSDSTNACVDSHDAATSAESSLIGCALQSCAGAARAASPLPLVRSGAVPMLIMHGADDCTIAPAQSQKLFDALQAAGSAPTLRIVPGAGSSATAWWFSAAPLADVDAFLDRHFRQGSKRRAVAR